jgi:hypothetical protein
VKSGLIIAATLLAFGVLVLLCLSLVPVHRVEAYVWHLRHGNFVTAGHFRFPVPEHWHVEVISQDMVMLVNLDNGDGVLLRSEKPPKGFTLARWSELQTTSSPERSIRATRELNVEGERVLCIERDDDLTRFKMHSIQCRAETGLDIMFTPNLSLDSEGSGRFYALLSHVQKMK